MVSESPQAARSRVGKISVFGSKVVDQGRRKQPVGCRLLHTGDCAYCSAPRTACRRKKQAGLCLAYRPHCRQRTRDPGSHRCRELSPPRTPDHRCRPRRTRSPVLRALVGNGRTGHDRVRVRDIASLPRRIFGGAGTRFKTKIPCTRNERVYTRSKRLPFLLLYALQNP